MKKVIILIGILFASSVVFSQTIEYRYQMPNPQIKKTRGDYELLFFPSSKQSGKTGAPSLPYFPVSLLLPPNTEAKSVEYEFSERTKLSGRHLLYPRQRVRPVSKSSPTASIDCNELVYSSNHYPLKKTSEVTTQFMNGYGFAMSQFTPVEYNPQTGEIFYYKTVKVRVQYKKTDREMLASLSQGEAARKRVISLSQNPENIKLYRPSHKKISYEMLIISSDVYLENFEELRRLHLARGVRTKLISVEQIAYHYEGRDLQEKIRNCIIQEYSQFDIQYVMLGGDVEIVPSRGLFCKVLSGDKTYSDASIPSDIYYASLDGTWNDDNDNLWGEPDEGDLLPEIAVGRLPFSSEAELSAIIHKITGYVNSPVLSGELKKPLIAGEKLFDDPITWGADFLDLIINHHEENGYVTEGISTEYKFISAREGTWFGDGYSITKEINKGYSFVHHAGHSNEDFMMGLYLPKVTNEAFSSLNGIDHNYTLVYSHGCICGAFDKDDCISERMVTIENFAVGVFTNSRYGWFNEGETEGPSAHLHREFVNALYGERENHAGEAELISKAKTAPWVGLEDEFECGAQRWCCYSHNALSDPALPIWTNDTLSIKTVFSADPQISENLTIDVSSLSFPVADVVCVLLQGDKFIGKGTTDNEGYTTIYIDPSEAVPGEADLYVSGYNILTRSYPVSISPNAGVALAFGEIDFSSDDGLNIAEEAGLRIKIHNFGKQTANNVKILAESRDDNLVVHSSEAVVGDVNASGVSVSDGEIKIKSSKVQDNYLTFISLRVMSDEDTLEKVFPLSVKAPRLELERVRIEELGGDGDENLELGENGRIAFKFKNCGHYKLSDFSFTLSCENSDIEIDASQDITGEVDAGGDFTISGDFFVPNDENLDLLRFKCSLLCGIYSLEKSVDVFLGVRMEDFETGNFSKFSWESESKPWRVFSYDVYEGNYSAASGKVGLSGESVLRLDVNLADEDKISFYKKVINLSDSDYLAFYVDDDLVGKWNHSVDWSPETFVLPCGEHTLRWVYSRSSGVVSVNASGARLDNIVLPRFLLASDSVLCENRATSRFPRIFPTIFSHSVRIFYEADVEREFRLSIYDVFGRLVYDKKFLAETGRHDFFITDLEHLSSGVYAYRIDFGGRHSSGKLVKK